MSGKFESIVLAGLATGVIASLLEAVPGASGCLACAAYIGSGTLAVWHYANTYGVTLAAGSGAGMGAAAGGLAGIVSGVIDFVIARLGGRPSFQEQMESALRALEEGGMNTRQLEQVEAWAQSPGFLIAAVAFGLLMVVAMGAIGGVTGAGAFRRGDEPVG